MLCARCSKNEIKYKARKLCASCYVVMFRRGEIEKAPPVLKCSNVKCQSKSPKKFVKGLCIACYWRMRNKGYLEYEDTSPKSCNIEGCKSLAIVKGYCNTHRMRVQRHGDVAAGRPEGWGSIPFVEARRREHLRDRFDLSLEEYEEMLKSQGGGCAICGGQARMFKGKPKNLHVDHDHKTGKIRGLLCDSHNSGIGLFCDSPELLRSAALYLEKYIDK